MAAPEQSRTTRVGAVRPPGASNAIVLVIDRSIARADLPAICERVRLLLTRGDADLIVCDVGALATPDAVTVDVLARLQLTARRLGHELRVRHASCELRELLAFVGLSDVMPLGSGLRLESEGQPEEREQARIEEEAELDDPAG